MDEAYSIVAWCIFRASRYFPRTSGMGEPAFGTWQRLIFFEMDEPKDRTITFHVFGG